jgi:hypothetical protein
MTVHAFVDESRRNSTYYVAAAIVVPGQLTRTRKAMRSLLLPGQREIHFYKERPPRRRMIVDFIARLPLEIRMYQQPCGRHEEPARQECLKLLVQDLMDRDARRLVIDSREDRDRIDLETIRNAVRDQQHSAMLVFEHMTSTSDELLWIADIAAWCYGTGGDWRARLKSIITAAGRP